MTAYVWSHHSQHSLLPGNDCSSDKLNQLGQVVENCVSIANNLGKQPLFIRFLVLRNYEIFIFKYCFEALRIVKNVGLE